MACHSQLTMASFNSDKTEGTEAGLSGSVKLRVGFSRLIEHDTRTCNLMRLVRVSQPWEA